MNIDMKNLGASLTSQFKNLAGRPPGQWPIVPRLMCGVAVVAAVVAAGYFAYWSGQFETEAGLAEQEIKLREEYSMKVRQAVNLDALKLQRAQVDLYVERLQKQLPSKAEMAALLSDINQAGIGRGLQFELFKPGVVVVRDYYAELPINIKVTGSYHDIGSFAADMASLPRIVTLNNMKLTTTKEGELSLEAVAKTFRYLDAEEAATARTLRLEREKKEKEAKKKGGAAK